MFPVFFPGRPAFDQPISLLSTRGVHRHPACGGDLMPAGSGFVPGRMPFPVRKILRWKPRGTDDIGVQVSRSIVEYSNSDLSLQIMASK